MFGLGTLINTGAIILGGLIGMLAGGLIKERFQQILIVALGLSTIAMSISDMVAKMLDINGGTVGTHGTYTIIFSLVLGGLAGELINLDEKMERFGTWLKHKSGSDGDAGFVNGFVTASLTVCIGAMAIVGSLMDGIYGDYSILLVKGILDFCIIIVMTASMGKGCMFSAIPVFILQGSVTLLARVIEPFMNEAATANLSMVGSILIICIGVNLIADGKFRFKVANMLPAVVFAVVAAYIPFLG